jgi:hypothetical protein
MPSLLLCSCFSRVVPHQDDLSLANAFVPEIVADKNAYRESPERNATDGGLFASKGIFEPYDSLLISL